MNSAIKVLSLLILFFCWNNHLLPAQSPGNPPVDSTAGKSRNLWAYDVLQIGQQARKPGKAVKVAVIDDGFRLSHNSLQGFVYTNGKEIPNNYQDDDRNGFPDDVHGWDISDGDNDVSVPEGRENEFYHGTYISGIITSVFKRFYGESAENYLKIIPVKVLADQAKSTYLADGYKGLIYACGMEPDIICCAWNGGEMPVACKAALNEAMRKGTIVVTSAGNLFSEKIDAPTSFPGVITVAAVDSLFRKTPASNYGMPVVKKIREKMIRSEEEESLIGGLFL